MTRGCLSAAQRWSLEIIEELGFGRIEGLAIRNGGPCFDPAPRIVQEIKLGSAPERRGDSGNADIPLRKEFESLFNHLSGLRDAIVSIDVRHGAPFRLELERRHTELVSPEERYA
jgi:hypothetical protein